VKEEKFRRKSTSVNGHLPKRKLKEKLLGHNPFTRRGVATKEFARICPLTSKKTVGKGYIKVQGEKRPEAKGSAHTAKT